MAATVAAPHPRGKTEPLFASCPTWTAFTRSTRDRFGNAFPDESHLPTSTPIPRLRLKSRAGGAPPATLLSREQRSHVQRTKRDARGVTCAEPELGRGGRSGKGGGVCPRPTRKRGGTVAGGGALTFPAASQQQQQQQQLRVRSGGEPKSRAARREARNQREGIREREREAAARAPRRTPRRRQTRGQ